MNKRVAIILLMAIFAGHGSRAASQVMPDQELVSLLDYISRNNYSERVFMDTDRDVYFAGDQLCLSIFLMEGAYMQPAGVSNVITVELLDGANQPVAREKFMLEHSRGAGILKLPGSLVTGNYILRSYSNWMRNGDPELFFHKIIPVINPREAPLNLYGGQTSKVHAGFYPEGGSIATGTANRVVVKLQNSFNRPFTDACHIVNQRMDTLASIALDSLGMGSFTYLPEPGLAAGIYHSDSLYPLPAPDPDAIALRAVVKRGGYAVELVPGRGRQENESIILLVHQQGMISYHERIVMSRQGISRMLEPDVLPEGISEVLVLNSGYEKLASRLLYKPIAGSAEAPTIAFSKTTAGKRDSVHVTIQSAPHAMISASVYLPGTATGMTELQALETALAAQTGIRGVRNAEQLDRALVAALVSEEPFLAALGKEFTFPPEIRGQLITGKLLNGDRQMGAGTTLYMAHLGSNTDVEKVIIQDDGTFYISPTEQQYHGQLVFLNDSLEKLNILIQPVFSEQYANIGTPDLNPATFPFQNLEKLLIANQLRSLYTSDTTRFVGPPDFKFYGQPDESVYFDDYIRLPVMEEFFRELVKNSIFTREEGRLKLNVLSKYTNRIIGADPMYIVDGIPVFDTRTILDFDPELIKSIHIVASKYIYGNLEMDGIVDIETRAGDGSILQLDENIASYMYQPAQIVDGAVVSGVNAVPDGPEPDQRTVICWQPLLQSDQTGDLTFSFVTSDVAGEYMVKLTVVERDGRIHQLYDTIQVAGPADPE